MATTSPNPASPPTPTSEIAHLTKILIVGFAILAILAVAVVVIQVAAWKYGGAQSPAHLPTEWGEKLNEILVAVQPPEEEEPAAAPTAPVAPPTSAPVPAPSQLDRIEGAIVALADKVDGVPTTKWVRGGTFVSRSVARHASGRYSVWMPEAGGNWLLASEQGKHLAVLLDGKWVNVFLLEDVDRTFSATTTD